jgi:hypothetical protein
MDARRSEGFLDFCGNAVMPTKRLFLDTLSDSHLTLLLRAVQYSHDVTIEGWLQDLSQGMLAIFELADGKGLIGFRRFPDHIFVEFLVGRDLRPLTAEILEFVRAQAQGKKIEALVTRPGLVKYYSMLGFKPFGTWMRL